MFSCGHSHENQLAHVHDHGHESEGHAGEDHAEGEIHLTKDQINTMGITFGDFSNQKINDFITATGTLGLPPNAYSSVSAKASGFIKESKKYIEGNYVEKGVVLAYLENPEFIKYQQAYLEVVAELSYLNPELERQQRLLEADAGISKTVQKLQSEVSLKMAALKGLEKQLIYLGINASNLSVDNIVERIPVLSPMSGYITSIKMHNGMYVTPELELMEVVSEDHLHLELDVFEMDIAGLKVGQKISYTVPALGDTVYEGEVHVIGKEFNVQNKTVRIHGHLEKKRPQFIKDLYVEAKVWLNDQTVQALPEKAIIQDGAFSYIYVAKPLQDGDELEFEALKVIPGASSMGFTSLKLIDPVPEGMSIVTNGAYFVYAQSKSGELTHEH
ncbi:MAG: efflux RND transporter periplasmic adaptor subunit [Saprospiraceae bacterium]|nr:efflux RND transporter periplasmic adaptor subunit [Saprospiraceae bacterium]